MKLKNNKRGFTLIELIVVLSIVAIVIGAVSSFLISNVNTFNLASRQIELQDEARKAINSFEKQGIEAGSVSRMFEGGVEVTNAISSTTVTQIDFRRGPVSSGAEIFAKYRLDRTESKLYFRPDDIQPETLVAEMITDFTLEAIPSTANILGVACTGLKIEIKTKDKDTEFVLKSQFYFRNR